jgi:hypothetical protein
MRIVGSTGNVLIGTTTDAGYKLDVNGTARVQGTAYVGPNQIRPFSSSIAVDPTGGNIAIIPNNVSNTLIDSTGAIFLRSSTVAITSNLFNLCSIQTVFSPTSGTGVNNNLVIHPIINQTGGANGITRGLYVNPALTAAADFRAIETTAGNVLFGTGFTWNNTNGRLGIGTSSPLYSIHSTGTISTGTGNLFDGTLRIERSGGGTGLVIQGSNGNVIGGGSYPVYEPYNYATADHNFNIGHASAGNYNWFVGVNSTLNLNTNLMRLTRGGNLLINTTRDAGYKLDVNGTARFTNYV